MSDDRVSVLVELDPLDHRLVTHAQQTTPYPDSEHPVLLPMFWTLDKPKNLGRERGSHADGSSATHGRVRGARNAS